MRSIVLLALLATPLALATHSASPCAAEVTTVEAGPQTLYAARDPIYPDVWIYLEMNDHAGLQRGGYTHEGALLPADDLWCWDRELATGEEIWDPDYLLASL